MYLLDRLRPSRRLSENLSPYIPPRDLKQPFKTDLDFFARSLFLWLFIWPAGLLQAQSYAAESIPAALKTGADAVVRSSAVEVIITSPGKAVIREHAVISILNRRAEDEGSLRIDYDPMRPLTSAEGTLYNSEGKVIRHVKKKEMIDRPVWDGMSLATDDRYKLVSFSSPSFPYTVSFDFEQELLGIISLPGWYPQTAPGSAVEHSRYSITAPKGYKVRYRMLNSDIAPVITGSKDNVTYTWELGDLKAVEQESFARAWNATQPYLIVGPSEFEAAGYKGDMSTWEEYGKFFAALSKGRDALPEGVRAQVHELVDREKDVRRKIAKLYDYLQKNTHYVGVQFGIGGWQPFDANYVSRNKYGDCKALSNYMIALLKEAGIPGNVVLIHAGENETSFVPDFPDNQFNHVIACVPLERDTVWMDCVNQYLPAGYLGTFTSNRYGLLITPQGGKLVHTPDYSAANRQSRHIAAEVDAEGNVKIEGQSVYEAESQDRVEEIYHHYSKNDQEALLKRQFDLPTYDVASFEYTPQTNEPLPKMEEKLGLAITGYAQVSGSRLFLNPDLITRSTVMFPASEKRRCELLFPEAFQQEDSVEISLPQGYSLESGIKEYDLKTTYGEYRRKAILSDGKITYHRFFKQFRGTFPASGFADACIFYNNIYRADRERIVMVKKK